MMNIALFAVIACASAADLSMVAGGVTNTLSFDGTSLDLGSSPVSLGAITDLEQAVTTNHCATTESIVTSISVDTVAMRAIQSSMDTDLSALASSIASLHNKIDIITAFTASNPGDSQANPAANCQAIYQSSPTSTDGNYWIDAGGVFPPMAVWCDMSNGGGWTQVAMIDGDDQAHSNIGAVGDNIVRPTTTTTSKYSDAVINAIINAHPVQSKATIRFECGSMPVNYYRACPWRATRGLGNAEDQTCVTAYGNQDATSVISSSRCNDGSQGVGSHCSSDAAYTATYCSHCANGDAAGGHNRMGCWHDTHNNGAQSHSGKLFVRGYTSSLGLAETMPADNCQQIHDAGLASGLYYIALPSGTKQVYCESTQGGGWALAAWIDGNDQDHSNTGAVGAQPVVDSGATSKLSDTDIDFLKGHHSGGAEIRFECGSMPTNYFTNCAWRATRGLGNAEDQDCVTAYGNQDATNVISTSRCNDGSQGVGSHCSSDATYTATYCSHCANGDAAGGHNRMGCWHDTHNNGSQSHSGKVYVR